MKKTILISALLFVSIGLFSQQKQLENKSAPKDSITSQDIAKAKYIISVIINEYNQQCYSDSMKVSDIYGKPVGGIFWREKAQYYWNVFEPIPNNVAYLHRRMTIEGLLEFMQTRLGGM